jgi:hypothetical protein
LLELNFHTGGLNGISRSKSGCLVQHQYFAEDKGASLLTRKACVEAKAREQKWGVLRLTLQFSLGQFGTADRQLARSFRAYGFGMPLALRSIAL